MDSTRFVVEAETVANSEAVVDVVETKDTVAEVDEVLSEEDVAVVVLVVAEHHGEDPVVQTNHNPTTLRVGSHIFLVICDPMPLFKLHTCNLP